MFPEQIAPTFRVLFFIKLATIDTIGINKYQTVLARVIAYVRTGSKGIKVLNSTLVSVTWLARTTLEAKQTGLGA